MGKEYSINGQAFDLLTLREFMRTQLFRPELADFITPVHSSYIRKLLHCTYDVSGFVVFDFDESDYRLLCEELHEWERMYDSARYYACSIYPQDFVKCHELTLAIRKAYRPISDEELNALEDVESLKSLYPDKDDTFVCDGDSVETFSDSCLYPSSAQSAERTSEQLFNMLQAVRRVCRVKGGFASYFDSKIRKHYELLGYSVLFVRDGGVSDAQD